MAKQISEKYIGSIIKSIGITFSDDGESVPVKMGRLEFMGQLHSKVVSQLYLEIMTMGGMPHYAVVGAVTRVLKKSEVTEMHLAGEFLSATGKMQIWINNDFCENVRVVIPSGDEILHISLESVDFKNDVSADRINK